MNLADRPTPETNARTYDAGGHRHADGALVTSDFARDLEQRVSALREALEVVLASASPNPRDNPAMYPVWESARKTLAATKSPTP